MRLLVLYHAGFTYSSPIYHYLDALRRHSRHDIDFYNVDNEDGEPDFSGYGALFLNFCIASLARGPLPPFLGPLIEGLRRYDGLKIAAVQDEYDFTNRVKGFLAEFGVGAVLTNVPAHAVRQIYSEPAFDRVRFETVHTGYMSDDVLAPAPPLAERPITLGYRGRELSYRLGDLCWHKAEVGRRFMVACLSRGIDFDIAVDEDARFTGNAWMEFVRSCRVMLGTPSGSNVFDFDGSIYQRIGRLQRDNPDLAYEDVRDEVKAHEVGFDMGQISPRIYEAVGSRTALALVRGSYSGVIEPDEHYVPIEADYSNIDDVLDRILDLPAMQAMADRAFVHVVNNPANHYSALAALIDGLVDGAGPRPGVVRLPVTERPLGNDPYLFQRVLDLRGVLNRLVDERQLEGMV